jgi:hypothetical protein
MDFFTRLNNLNASEAAAWALVVVTFLGILFAGL